MSNINSSDVFVVERNGTIYKVSAENLVSKLQANDLTLIERSGIKYKSSGIDGISDATGTDLMLVNRSGTNYKVTCSDVQAQWLLKWTTSATTGNTTQQARQMSRSGNILLNKLSTGTLYARSIDGGVSWTEHNMPVNTYTIARSQDNNSGFYVIETGGQNDIWFSSNGLNWSNTGNNAVIQPYWDTVVYHSDFDELIYANGTGAIGRTIMSTNTRVPASIQNNYTTIPWKRLILGPVGSNVIFAITNTSPSPSTRAFWFSTTIGSNFQEAAFVPVGNSWEATFNPTNNIWAALRLNKNTSNIHEVWRSSPLDPSSAPSAYYNSDLPGGNYRGFHYDPNTQRYYTFETSTNNVWYSDNSSNLTQWQIETSPTPMVVSDIITASNNNVVISALYGGIPPVYPNQYIYRTP